MHKAHETKKIRLFNILPFFIFYFFTIEKCIEINVYLMIMFINIYDTIDPLSLKDADDYNEWLWKIHMIRLNAEDESVFDDDDDDLTCGGG